MKIILFVLIIVIGIIFANKNDMYVSVRYYSFVMENIPLYSVILMSILLGFVGGALYSYIESFKIKSRLRNDIICQVI